MDRYDWGWGRGRGYGRDFGARRSRGYGSDFGGWGDVAWGAPPGAFQGRGPGQYGRGYAPWNAGGYDADVYGPSYPGYGGYPGGPERGMYYGGRGRYDAGYTRPGHQRGYESDFEQGRFLPEEAYRRHPEMERPRHHASGRWPDHGSLVTDEMDDEEIRWAVERSLHEDRWVPADRIQVEVHDQVVTLRGEVDDYMEARYAWDDAWDAAGVRGVINHLTVRVGEPEGAGGSDPLPQTGGGSHPGDTSSGG